MLIRPGASIPADGQVIEGGTNVDESIITGESRPMSKEPSSRVGALLMSLRTVIVAINAQFLRRVGLEP